MFTKFVHLMHIKSIQGKYIPFLTIESMLYKFLAIDLLNEL